MPIKRHRRLAIVALAFLGIALGAPSGYWIGRATLLRTARNSLSSFASDLLRHADEYAGELRDIRNAFNPSPYSFCSHEEIARMQEMTFRSLQVKDVGRTHDGKFYCSAFLGRLAQPMPVAPAAMLLSNGTRVSIHVSLVVAPSALGTVLENSGVTVVLSPNAFDHWSRPHVRFMILVTNRVTGQIAPIAGETLDVDPAWVLAQQEKQVAGEIYRSRCSTHSDVCIVTAESTDDIVSGSRALLIEYSGLGGFAGFGLGLAAAQFYARRIGLAQQLRRAIRKDALSLVYQPILELHSRRFVGAEALVRWSDEDGEPVAPDFFVRIAEDQGFIGELTAVVLRRATREIGDLLRQNPDFTLSINIAAADLEGERLLPLLERHVRQAGIQPGQIALELTERSTGGIACLQSAILRLHIHGYQIHIDDFGTGFSSLSYLHELAVDAIKIDRGFTRTSGTDAVTACILPQILSMAESVKVGVIVEGVETESQLNFLESTGKPMRAQGWYFGRPVAAPTLISIHAEANAATEIGVR
jgi:sensor c-di-GMP phosphodiesterase-like protein